MVDMQDPYTEKIETAKRLFREIAEIYAGMEGYDPDNPPGSYLDYKLQKIWLITREALSELE